MSRRATSVLLQLWVAAAFSWSAAAQVPAPHEPPSSIAASASRPSSVRGTVVRRVADGVRPVAGLWVVLHAVSVDTSGPIDSVRTNAAGQYQLRYNRADSSDA